MKTRRLFLAAVAFTLCSLPLHADEAADKAEVAKIEEEFTAAMVRGDVEALGRLVAPGWKYVGSRGEIVSRDEFFGVLKSGKLKFSQYANSQLDVRLFGEAAVVIGIGSGSGAWDGESFTSKDRFTDVYVRKDGKWQCVATHNSEIQGEK